jgi:hypothetical protein
MNTPTNKTVSDGDESDKGGKWLGNADHFE